MKPPRSQRLQRVTDVAEQRTDAAADVLAQRTRGLDAAQKQLRELQQFRREYALPAPGGAGVSVAELLNRQRFVARIDLAIAQQQREIEEWSRRLEDARAGWLASHHRSAALDTVTQRCLSAEQASDERAEQATLDERAQQRKQPWPNS